MPPISDTKPEALPEEDRIPETKDTEALLAAPDLPPDDIVVEPEVSDGVIAEPERLAYMMIDKAKEANTLAGKIEHFSRKLNNVLGEQVKLRINIDAANTNTMFLGIDMLKEFTEDRKLEVAHYLESQMIDEAKTLLYLVRENTTTLEKILGPYDGRG